MGIYIDPENFSKEDFLNQLGMEIGMDLLWGNVPSNMLPVCLVDNGPFIAAGIAHCEKKLKSFQLEHDTRPRKMYLVPIDAIKGALGEKGSEKLDAYLAGVQSDSPHPENVQSKK